MGQFQKMMATMRMFLLMVLSSLAKSDKVPTVHTTRVDGGTLKCFHYVVMEGQVMEMTYLVRNREQNTETTIDFLFTGSKEFIDLKQVNRKFGGVQTKVAGRYNVCFRNVISDLQNYVPGGEVERYDDDEDEGVSQECAGQHFISRQDGFSTDSIPILIHERSDIAVIDCGIHFCNQISVKRYNWFQETFACEEDDQDLEVIYEKYVDLYRSLESLMDAEDIIGSVGKKSKVLKEYIR